MFLDASAIVAIMTKESGWTALAARLERALAPQTSPVAAYETVTALTRKLAVPAETAQRDFRRFLATASVTVEPVTAKIADLALEAFKRYGKGRHRAALNMSDCFAYACAKARNAPLLFKGGSFVHTDIEAA